MLNKTMQQAIVHYNDLSLLFFLIIVKIHMVLSA